MFRLNHLLLIFALIFGTAAISPAAESASPTAAKTEKTEKAERLPGVDLSQGITEVTGVAISPLLGVSSVGAWRYFRTDSASRGKLPWFCHPAAWGCGLGILLLCFLKDTFGTTVPGVLKKPLDMIELFENKASALVASSAFVPVIAREMALHFSAEKGGEPVTAFLIPLASASGLSLVAISTTVVYLVASLFAFFAVWLSGHAINVLIILSPFSLLDALLKASRFFVLAIIAATYAIAPWLAAGICVLIIVIAIWRLPATLRLTVFGTRYASDVLLPWFGRRRATDESPHAFSMGRFAGLPVRTSGRLIRLTDGSVAFRYRSWWVGPERTIPVPDGRRVLSKGLISPAVAVCTPENTGGTKVLLLLPRYRGREESIVRHLDFHGVRDHALGRGFAAMRNWWNENIRRKRLSPEPDAGTLESS